jgi:hypothetical protein
MWMDAPPDYCCCCRHQVVNERRRTVFIKAFTTLLEDLYLLENEITTKVPLEDCRRMYVLPSDLETGAGY